MIFQKSKRLDSISEYYFSHKMEQINVLKAQGHHVINLGIGSPDLMPPSAAITKAEQSLKNSKVHGYSSYRSSKELRTAIGQWMEKNYQVKLDENKEILPLLGSKEGIFYLSMSLLNPGDEVLIPNPGYPTYTSVAHLVGAKCVYYDLIEKNHFLPDLDLLQKSDLSKCKMMWINYPHMPTGTSASEKFFEKILQFSQDNKIFIAHDNPYGFILNNKKPLSILQFDKNFHHACELNSLSKTYNMAGWRLGFIMGHQSLIDQVISVKSNVDSGMFLPLQHGAIEALKTDQHWIDQQNMIYQKRKIILLNIFDELGFTYDLNQTGLFIWAKAPTKLNINITQLVEDILTKVHVFLTPGMIFGTQGNHYLRGSLCSSEQDLNLALDRIKQYLKENPI